MATCESPATDRRHPHRADGRPERTRRRAPGTGLLALRLRALYQAEPTLRFREAQHRVLNVELAPLHQALMKAWRLPELLIRIADDRHAHQPNAKCVKLALRLARHTAQGWDDPAIAHDVSEIASLLNLSPTAALQLVQAI